MAPRTLDRRRDRIQIAAVTARQEDLADLRPGGALGDYRLIDVLGRGRSGSVYRAQKLGAPRLVALKVMNGEHFDDDIERQRFEREAEVVKRLAHPHVVSLLEYGFAAGLPYLAFPLLEGRTLEDRIKNEGPLDWGYTGQFSEEVLSALEVAHGMGIAHRDIKPANLFLSRGVYGETIQILDFGTAKIVGDPSDESDLTRVGTLVGTPRYMAPEQVRMEPLTPAADVYAFGLVMAEMLLGRPLVAGQSELEIYAQQGSDRPHALPDAIMASPFASVIERAVAKPLDIRYRLASQMLADVRAILARFSAGELGPGESDLEATVFYGMAPEHAEPDENAKKLRQAFNTIAERAPTAPPPAPPPAPATSMPAPARAPSPSFVPPSQPVWHPAPPPLPALPVSTSLAAARPRSAKASHIAVVVIACILSVAAILAPLARFFLLRAHLH